MFLWCELLHGASPPRARPWGSAGPLPSLNKADLGPGPRPRDRPAGPEALRLNRTETNPKRIREAAGVEGLLAAAATPHAAASPERAAMVAADAAAAAAMDADGAAARSLSRRDRRRRSVSLAGGRRSRPTRPPRRRRARTHAPPPFSASASQRTRPCLAVGRRPSCRDAARMPRGCRADAAQMPRVAPLWAEALVHRAIS